MNRAEFLKLHKTLCLRMHEICVAKNHDYAGAGGEDPFANFTRVEALGICSAERGMLVRMSDKLSRLSSFCESGQLMVKDESVLDSLLDLANYSLLMAGLIESRKPRRQATRSKKRK